jgi:molybdopterin-binding protein
VRTYRISEAAELLGVSSDTMRRWADAGRFAVVTDGAGRQAVDGAELARFAGETAAAAERPQPRPVVSESARNRFVGLVTKVTKDTVMAQVDIQAGPFRVVSLMSREAVDEMDLQVGSVAIAVIKSTTVVVEKPAATAGSRGRSGS